MFQSPFYFIKRILPKQTLNISLKSVYHFLNVAAQFSLYNIACAIPNVYNQIF